MTGTYNGHLWIYGQLIDISETDNWILCVLQSSNTSAPCIVREAPKLVQTCLPPGAANIQQEDGTCWEPFAIQPSLSVYHLLEVNMLRLYLYHSFAIHHLHFGSSRRVAPLNRLIRCSISLQFFVHCTWTTLIVNLYMYSITNCGKRKKQPWATYVIATWLSSRITFFLQQECMFCKILHNADSLFAFKCFTYVNTVASMHSSCPCPQTSLLPSELCHTSTASLHLLQDSDPPRKW